MNKKAIGILACVIVIVCAAVFGGIYVTRNIGKSEKVISEESAEKRLAKMVDKINPETGTPVKSPIEYDSAEDEADELPDIDTCKVMVEAETSLYAEIYSSPEKAGSGTRLRGGRAEGFRPDPQRQQRAGVGLHRHRESRSGRFRPFQHALGRHAERKRNRYGNDFRKPGGQRSRYPAFLQDQRTNRREIRKRRPESHHGGNRGRRIRNGVYQSLCQQRRLEFPNLHPGAVRSGESAV